jgi:uncharacterized protein (TIGR03663 family)
MSDTVLVPEHTPDPVVAPAPTRADDPRFARTSWFDKPLAAFPAWRWETIAWVLLVLLAGVLRFYDLGTRGMSHDESLHTMYGYYLFNEGRYEHNPMMHGPFRFHMTALSYFLFGASDFSSRLVPALLGTSLVALMYAFRRWIGRTGALVAAILITVSPSLLFHSRYIRDDIFIATFTTLWALGAFRYLETRRFRWLMLMVLAMGFSFVTMENSFITGAVFGGFIVMLAMWQAIAWRSLIVITPAIPLGIAAYYFHHNDQDNIAIPILGAIALMTIGLALFFLLRNKGWSRLRSALPADLAVLMATLVLPFMAPFAHMALGGEAKVFANSEYLTDALISRMALLVAGTSILAIALAVLWFRVIRKGDDEGRIGLNQWAQLMASFWVIQVLFYTTFFTNTRNGLASGLVGSLGYWLAQQNVERGSQPWYYYPFIGSMYEFLPIILTAAGAVVLIRGFVFQRNWSPVATSDLPAQRDAWSPEVAVSTRNAFVIFALVWVAGMWSAYTVAGEKMPWLLTHMALPMCVFGGWWAGRLIHAIDWRAAWDNRTAWLIGLLPAALLLLFILIRTVPEAGRGSEVAAAWMGFLLAGAALATLVYFGVRWSMDAGWRQAAPLYGVAMVAILFVFNTRASFMLTFVNYDMATEYLVYAHASPDVKRALREIESISQRTVGDRNIVVAYDDESSWPFTWYLRDYPNARFYGANPDSNSMSAPIVLVGPPNRDKVLPYLERDYVKRTYRRIWWPDMDYFNLNWDRIRFAITDPQQRERLMQIALFRRHRDTSDFSRFRDLTQWPARGEFDMWVRKDLANQIWDLNVTPLVGAAQSAAVTVPDFNQNASAMFVGPYDGLALLTPRAVAAAPNGNRIIADSGNQRIVIVDATGAERAVFGSRCDLAAGADGGCVDPDGSGPLALGDGQFNEPWGVAVDADNNIYVADTWNGRIQVFDATGAFLRKWGYFNTTNGELGDPNALFGPRGIAIDLAGNLVVADTGNKRIVRFATTGELVDQVGGGGVVAGRFDEPTSVSVDPSDGSIYVADAWNRRIQKFDGNMGFMAEWPVPGWESKAIYDKPGLAVAANGDVYASDPQFFRIFVFNKDGLLKGTFGRFGAEANRLGLPNGLAADLPNSSILVADADNNRAMLFPQLP